jgi:hypothetical protein
VKGSIDEAHAAYSPAPAPGVTFTRSSKIMP